MILLRFPCEMNDLNVKPFCGHLNVTLCGHLSSAPSQTSAEQKVQRPRVFTLATLRCKPMRSVTYRFRIAERRILAPFRKTRWKRSVCERNADPVQDRGCNDTDLVQCKRRSRYCHKRNNLITKANLYRLSLSKRGDISSVA